MASVVCELIKYTLWIIIKLIFKSTRSLIWQWKGINNNIKQMYKKDKIHIEKIHVRYRMDEFLSPCCYDNFISTHHCFTTDDYLLKPNVTLYNVTDNEAVFIETDDTVDVTHSSTGPFMRIEQFRHAQYVITMSLKQLIQIEKKLGKPKGGLIMLPNTGRCGSTLLSQILEASGRCVALSEPESLTSLCNFIQKSKSKKSDIGIDINVIITSIINTLCKPINKQDNVYVLKTMSQHTGLMPAIENAYDHQIKHIFMYRDRIPCVKSFYKLDKASVISKLLMVVVFKLKLTFVFDKFIETFHLDREVNMKFENKVHLCALSWAYTIYIYEKYCSEGQLMDLVAVKYEDILEHQDFAVKQIMDFCGLQYDPDEIQKALSKDSQRGTGFSKENLTDVKLDMSYSELKSNIDYVCNAFNLKYLPDDFVLANTITHPRN